MMALVCLAIAKAAPNPVVFVELISAYIAYCYSPRGCNHAKGDLANWAIWRIRRFGRLGPCQVTSGITRVRRSLRIQACIMLGYMYSARPLCRILLSLALYPKLRIDIMLLL